MVGTIKLTGPLGGNNIKRFFDDCNELLISRGVIVERRNLLVAIDKGKGDGAGLNERMDIMNSAGKIVADARLTS